MKRYEDECKMLQYLSSKNLNLEKNIKKENFEDMQLEDIWEKLKEEVGEVFQELFIRKMSGVVLKENIVFDDILHEIGDVGACLVGLIAWINKHRSEK